MEELIKEYRQKLGKKVFFAVGNETKVGTLVGLKLFYSDSYWIISINDTDVNIPTSESVTPLNN